MATIQLSGIKPGLSVHLMDSSVSEGQWLYFLFHGVHCLGWVEELGEVRQLLDSWFLNRQNGYLKKLFGLVPQRHDSPLRLSSGIILAAAYSHQEL